mmetsp:Transcript_9821/g.22311  ORF Transcript_9821/g.22311 Transcript_9821/m.22311 type:complete len:277 (-) Transcript_9821:944-1774(-)
MQLQGIVLQQGPYESLWIRLGSGGMAMAGAELLAEQIDASVAAHKTTGALYVALAEEQLQHEHIATLLQRNFKFHHYRAQAGCAGELVYYLWPGDGVDKVPHYSTSIEGVGALLLAPDEKSVLLVWEYGVWKTPTGAVDEGEGSLRALKREIREEVGLAVDDSFAPLHLGGWQLSEARDRRVNDNFNFYVMRASDFATRVDDDEISDARWFSIDELRKLSESPGNAVEPAIGGRIRMTGTSDGKDQASTVVVISSCTCICAHVHIYCVRQTRNCAH